MAEPFGPYLNQGVAGRVLVVGDSNVVFPAAQVVCASSGFDGTAVPMLALEYTCAVPGIGLRDVDELVGLLGYVDSTLGLSSYDAVLVNLGANDILQQDSDWAAYTTGPPTYPARVKALLDALPNVPIFWIGVPAGLPSPPFHALEILFVDYTLASFDTSTGSTYAAYRGGFSADARVRYIGPDAYLGSISPRYLPDGVHYAPEAAQALYDAVCALIRATLA